MRDREVYTNLYDRLISIGTNGIEYEIQTDDTGRHLKMKDHIYPVGILESEIIFITMLIEKFELKRGLDIGTGTGAAAFAAASGFLKTGGKVVTIDNYREEVGRDFNSGLFKPDGYLSVLQFKEKMRLENSDVIVPYIRDARTYIGDIIEQEFGKDQKIDYLFIDIDDVSQIIDRVKPYMDDHCIVLRKTHVDGKRSLVINT